MKQFHVWREQDTADCQRKYWMVQARYGHANNVRTADEAAAAYANGHSIPDGTRIMVVEYRENDERAIMREYVLEAPPAPRMIPRRV